MNRLLARLCLGLACLLVVPTVADAQISSKRSVKSSKAKKKKSVRKSKTRRVRRVTRTKSRRGLKSTKGAVSARNKTPSKLKAPPGRRAPRTRAPRGRAYRDGYYYDRGYRNGGYRNGYNDGYDDANFRSRRRRGGDGGGGTSGRSQAPKKPGPPSWSGGLLIGGAGGATVFDETEHETSIGIFGELNFRGVVSRNLSLGIHAGGAHNRVQSSTIDSITLGSLGGDLAYHFSRGRSGPYLRGGAGFAHATLDPSDAFAPESAGGGWYAKAGVGISTGTILIEGNCTQYTFDDMAMPGGPEKAAAFTRCGVALGFGR